MTGYNSQVGGGMYRIQMETNRHEVYDCVQSVIRSFTQFAPMMEWTVALAQKRLILARVKTARTGNRRRNDL